MIQIIITKTIEIAFNPEEERRRIRRLFKNGVYRDSLIEVIDVFEKDGLNAALEIYYKLPYNEKDEYPLQESMGVWWHNIFGDLLYCEDSKAKMYEKIEIIK